MPKRSSITSSTCLLHRSWIIYHCRPKLTSTWLLYTNTYTTIHRRSSATRLDFVSIRIRILILKTYFKTCRIMFFIGTRLFVHFTPPFSRRSWRLVLRCGADRWRWERTLVWGPALGRSGSWSPLLITTNSTSVSLWRYQTIPPSAKLTVVWVSYYLFSFVGFYYNIDQIYSSPRYNSNINDISNFYQIKIYLKSADTLSLFR